MITDYGVKALIGAGLRNKATPMSDLIDQLAPTVDSQVPAGQTERLDFLGAIPALRKWIGSRQAKRVLQQLQTAVLEKHEATVDIPLDLVRNDKSGQVGEIAGALPMSLRRWKTKLLFELLSAADGTTLGTAFTGKSFFATDHSWNGRTYDNDLTHAAATGTAPTANEAADAICEAIQKLYSFVDDQGEPINEDMSRLVIVVGTTIGNAIFQAVNQATIDTGAGTRDNPVVGWKRGLAIDVLVSPRYTDADAFAMLNASPGACPMVFVENQGERMLTSKAAGSDYEHDQDAWQYGVKAVGVGAYGRITDAVLMTFT